MRLPLLLGLTRLVVLAMVLEPACARQAPAPPPLHPSTLDRCATVTECVMVASRDPGQFTPSIRRLLTSLPYDEVIAGLTYRHPRQALTDIVQQAVKGDLWSHQGALTQDVAQRVLEHVEHDDLGDLRGVIISKLFQTTVGRDLIERRIEKIDDELSLLAAHVLVDQQGPQAFALAQLRVWNAYLASRGSPDGTPAISLVDGNAQQSFERGLLDLLEADAARGALNSTDLDVLARYARRGHLDRLVQWSADPRPSIAEPARRALCSALENLAVRSYQLAARPQWRSFLLRRAAEPDWCWGPALRVLESSLPDLTEAEVTPLISLAMSTSPESSNAVLPFFIEAGNHWPQAREPVRRALFSQDLAQVTAAIDAIKRASELNEWSMPMVVEWLLQLPAETSLDPAWAPLLLHVGTFLEPRLSRRFGFPSRGDVGCRGGSRYWEEWRRQRDLEAFGLREPEPPPTKGVPRDPEKEILQHPERLQAAVKKLRDYLADPRNRIRRPEF